MGKVHVHRRNADILDVTWAGHITLDDVARATDLVQLQLGVRPPRALIGDTSAVTGFDRDVRGAAAALVGAVRSGGVEVMVTIAPSVLVRMAVSTFALVARMPVEFVESVSDAEALVRKKLSRVAQRHVSPS